MSQDLNITVAVRCRGRNQREVAQKSSIVVTVPNVSGANEVIINTTGDVGIAAQLNSKRYTVDKVFGPSASQSLLFAEVAQPLFHEFIQGYNCTMLVYGMTSTGKTYTMTGDEQLDGNDTLSEKAGIIPRILFQLFDTLKEQDLDHIVKCSFIELYNEELKDLLDNDGNEQYKKLRIFDSTPDSRNNSPKLNQRNNAKKYNYKLRRTSMQPSNPGASGTYTTMAGNNNNNNSNNTSASMSQGSNDNNTIYIQNLQEFHITSANEGLALLQKGLAHRQVATTKMNDFSSRSHTIFTITLYKQHQGELFRLSKMNLVDLAGSENISRSGALNQRAKEAGSINQSLLTLGRVINALADKSSHVPFRESKLTRLLQDSLGGNTKTALIATISPAKATSDETCSTLEYASKAKNIKNKPQLGSFVMKDILLKNVTTELAKLKSDLLSTKSKDGVFMSQQHYKEMNHDMENYKTELEEAKRLIKSLNEKVDGLTDEKQKLTKSLDLQNIKTDSLNDSINELQEKIVASSETENQLNNQIVTLNESMSSLKNEIKAFKKKELSIDSRFKLILNDQLMILKEKFLNQLDDLQAYDDESFEVQPHIDNLQKEISSSLTILETNIRDSYQSCIGEFLKETPTLFKEVEDNVTNINLLSTHFYKQISENLSDISEEYNNLKQYLNDRLFQNNHEERLGNYINKTTELMEQSSSNLMENVKDMVENYLLSNKQLLIDSMQRSTSDIIEQEMKLLKPKKQKWESSIELINRCDSLSNTYFNNMNNTLDSTKGNINMSNEKIKKSVIKINDRFSDQERDERRDVITKNKNIKDNIKQIVEKTNTLKSRFDETHSLAKYSVNEINGLDKSIRTILHDIEPTTTTNIIEQNIFLKDNSTGMGPRSKSPLKISSNNLNFSEVESNNNGTKKRRLSRDEIDGFASTQK
ncbi:similar to Saccharomyces cerevisiae YEL061C CIN8 Kinesin motor protein involved in mitotic spindle assembly and chromosome segregation [Maudiozyma saulgeensis]|uniref:Kinesin-like protein n=1 Tax=Maudiozyma saulgeensis TaxID=1789683 RepID=A0A1X7RCJ0_9SACH|nr:similar to Saccharomyces cerevisiae YEL061C CIN8 Kinesin motor protein involved in mitotic spindle assembly and chromosome segregation [Kazachstania saulgeensis]